MSRSREDAERLGQRAETIALWFLRLKGYRLLARRFTSPAGEIDLVMRQGQTTVFVEVKARRSVDDGVIAVTPRQSRRIAAAAALFVTQHPGMAQTYQRFDIVAVPPHLWPTHITNAFEGF